MVKLKGVEYVLNTCYQIESSIKDGNDNEYRFNFEIEGKLFASDCSVDTDNRVEIGRCSIFKVMIEEARENKIDLFELWDMRHETMDIAERIFDFEKGKINQKIEEYYNFEISNENILILNRMEILPAWQGKGIGKSWSKEIQLMFKEGLSVLKSYPLQLEEGAVEGNTDEWGKRMKYSKNGLEDEEIKASLMNHHLSKGFEAIPGIENDIIFYNPSFINRKMKKIKY